MADNFQKNYGEFEENEKLSVVFINSTLENN